MRLLTWNRIVGVGLILVVLLAPMNVARAQGGTVTHVVAAGEDVWAVAARYGVSVPAIILANQLPDLNIAVGQKLVIPSTGAVASPSAPAVPPPSLASSPTVQEGATVHTVAAGEGLYRIALRYGVTVSALTWANGLSNPHLIYVGQRLVIPNRQGTTPPPNPGPVTPPQPTGSTGKEIVVVLHEQRVYAYENGKLVHSSLASTGVARYPTPVGRYKIYVKYLSTLMTGPGYYLPNVPYTMYFYAGYGLHGTYWHNNFGHPMSHGCVNVPTSEARWFYEWAPVGTPVTVKA
jgi:LysM repeat protein